MAGRIVVGLGILLASATMAVVAAAQDAVPALVQIGGDLVDKIGPARTETISPPRTLSGAKEGESRQNRRPAHVPSDTRRRALAESFGKLPLTFEANQGQTDRRVQFLSRGSGYSLFITPTEAVLALHGSGEAPDSSVRAAHVSATRLPNSIKGTAANRGAVLRMKLVGGNPAPVASGLDPLPGTSNYLIGNDPKQWRTNVPNYAKVQFAEVYPGVDLVYYGNHHRLEYDFIVAPGADPTAITLGFAGAERLEIDGTGELTLQTKVGEVRWHKPLVYQEVQGVRQIVDGRYVRKEKDAVGFAVDTYDPRQPLIIDPVLVYSTYLGGSGEDVGTGIAVDAAGNAYVTGFTSSANFPGTSSSLIQAALADTTNAFVTKLNAAGDELVYSTYLGGGPGPSCGGAVFSSGGARAYGIAVDSSGSAYITGSASVNFPTTTGTFQVDFCSSGNAFVTKLNPAGNALAYSTYLGGNDRSGCFKCAVNDGFAIAVDSVGNAYVTGRTTASNFPIMNAFQPMLRGSEDAFVTKLNATGNALLYSTYLGGGSDNGYSIAVDASGNAYVTGFTQSADFPTTNAAQGIFGGNVDAFVAKIDTAGPVETSLVYSTYLGGSGQDFGNAVAVDSSGNAFVTGLTSSATFPTTIGAFQPALSGFVFDAFVTQAKSGGSVLVSTYLGGSQGDEGNGIAVDSSGNVYVTGVTGSTDFPTTVDAVQTTLNPFSVDAFVVKLNAAGTALVYSTYLGGSGREATFSFSNMALDSLGNVYVTGETFSTDFPTVGPSQVTSGGAGDAFVAKIGFASTILPPRIAKSFAATKIAPFITTPLTFELSNPNPSTTLNDVGFVDPLDGLVASTTISNSCGGSVDVGYRIELRGGSITPAGSCTVSILIASDGSEPDGLLWNFTGATSSNGGIGNTASASVTVGPVQPPRLFKAFSPTTVFAGQHANLTFEVLNNNPDTELNGLAIVDPMPGGLLPSSVSSNTCGGTVALDASRILLTGGSVRAGSQCQVVVDVVPDTVGAKMNTTETIRSSNSELGNIASATLTVMAHSPTIAKAFSPAAIEVGQHSQLTFTLSNSNPFSVSGLAFTDPLPEGLTAPFPISSSCGILTFDQTLNTIAVSGFLSGLSNCQTVVDLTATSAGTKINNTGPVTSFNAPSGNTASATLSVSKATSTTSLASSPDPSKVSQSVILTATVSGYAPTGAATFSVDGVVLGPVSVNAGIATTTVAGLSLGQHTITASYVGDGNNLPSTSPVLTQWVTTGNGRLQTTTTLAVSSNTVQLGQPVTLTATVSGAAPTGTVTFMDVNTVLGVVNLDASGVATLTTTALAQGAHQVTATYSGDSNNLLSSSLKIKVQVVQ